MDSVCDEMPPFWEWCEEIKSFARFERFTRRDHGLGVGNQIEIEDAQRALKKASGWISVENHCLPDEFPPPRLALPEKGFASDYFTYGSYHFASRKLREVMAQPAEVVQWAAVNLVAGGEEARAQDYRWMRVLAVQDALDLERSDYTPTERLRPDIMTGEPRHKASWAKRWAFLDGVVARTEIFCPRETYAMWVVTDGLAERVMRAKCTGVAFRDPTQLQSGDGPRRYRTADGVVER